MASQTSEKTDKPNFTIENNIIKGPKCVLEFKTHNIGQLILNTFDDEPNHIAQIETETGKQTTLNEMKENSIRCALWMQMQGIGIGDVVAVCTHIHADAYIPVISTLLIGAIYNPWHYEISLKTAQDLMKLTRPKIIFACKSTVEVLREAAQLEKVQTRIIVFGSYPGFESLEDIPRLLTKKDVETFTVAQIKDPESLTTMITFSSGTTGYPKAIAHSYKSILSMLTSPKYKCVFLFYSSLYWMSGTIYFLRSILTLATLILHTSFDPIETCKIIEKYEVDTIFIVPAIIVRWIKSKALKNYELKSLRVIFTSGSKLKCEFVDEICRDLPHIKILLYYGLTEIAGAALVRNCIQYRNSNSIGFTFPNIELKVVHMNTGESLGPNKPGELYVKSITMTIGFYKNAFETTSAIDNNGWLHTGDQVYYDESGEFYFIDRIKEIMKFRGHCVSPIQLEDILVDHPDVMEAVVVSIPHEEDGDRPMAFVRKLHGSKVTEDELIELTSVLEENKQLWGGVKFLDKMPLTPSGKINRRVLKEIAKTYSTQE